MTKIGFNDYSFDYIEGGNGEPLVLIHGSASDYRTWNAQQAELSKRFRAISYSRRYHWPNEPIGEGADYSMLEHVRDLEELLHSLDAAPTHLVGHSYGAFIALLLAIQKPQLIRTLVLVEPPAITLFVSNTPTPPEILILLLTRPRLAARIIQFGVQGVTPATKAFQHGDRDAALKAFGEASLSKETFHSLSPSRLEQVRANLIEAELLGSGFPPLDTDQIRRIQIPTLLMNAQKSPRIYHYLLDRIEELMPNTQRTEIPNASHIIHEDNAPAFTEALISFIETSGNEN